MPEPIPQRIDVKPRFEQHYRELLGDDYDRFIEYSSAYIRKAIRVNTLKISVPELKKRLSRNWSLKQVLWCEEGFWLEHKDKRYDVGNLPEHMLGYVYVQEAASMIPPVVLDPKPGELVLDMCAAPGSKSTQMSAMMKNEGLIVCNDVKGDRLKALGINIQRMGCSNIVITKLQGNQIKQEFDKILVDAPCSGTGTIRRSLRVLREWNLRSVDKLSRLQFLLLSHAFRILRSGGTMVYSTCTLEPLEDEGVVTRLLERFPDAELLPINIDIKRSPAVKEFQGKKFHEDVDKCLRIYPYDNDTEGFFVAKIRKK